MSRTFSKETLLEGRVLAYESVDNNGFEGRFEDGIFYGGDTYSKRDGRYTLEEDGYGRILFLEGTCTRNCKYYLEEDRISGWNLFRGRPNSNDLIAWINTDTGYAYRNKYEKTNMVFRLEED